VVELVSPEDIFLFKAVAGRVDDIEDIFSLMQTGLEFDVVEAELEAQVELLDQELFVTYVNEALTDLTEQTQRDDTAARPCRGDHRAGLRGTGGVARA